MLVGILGNYDEILSAEALKATHFLDLCEKKGIPALFLQNSAPLEKREPGMRDLDVGVLKDRGKLSSAVATFSNPKISLTLTSCHGDDLLLMVKYIYKISHLLELQRGILKLNTVWTIVQPKFYVHVAISAAFFP